MQPALPDPDPPSETADTSARPILCAFLGAIFLGPVGGIVGYLLGYLFSFNNKKNGGISDKILYHISALFAAVMKADNSIMKSELYSYRDFFLQRFGTEAAGKAIEDACFEGVYSLFEGHTWYVQRLLNELYAWTGPGETATAQMLPDVVTYVVKTYERTFQEQLSDMPEAQKMLLIAVAKEGKAEQVTSIAFCKKHAMKSPSTVQSALRALHDKGVLRKDSDSYSVANRMLEIWVKEEY